VTPRSFGGCMLATQPKLAPLGFEVAKVAEAGD
jgi:hypothetical protein